MASQEELYQERLKKLESLEAKGMLGFPAETKRTHAVSSFLSSGHTENSEPAVLAGRVMSVRGGGGLIFADIYDGTGRVQIVLKGEETGEEVRKTFQDMVDMGDFIEISGHSFITKNGQHSLLASSFVMLAKALLPLPDKYKGLQDEEEKMRKRYLDLLLDEDKKSLFYKKSLFWKTIRNYLDDKGFLEVETPTIEITTGGAEARPFKTYHNDFDIDVYMRISIGELWQKRLMAAGFPKTYEIGRAYRNEGSSPEHLQEFTNCEFYMAYADYKEGMSVVKDLYRKIAKDVFGKTSFDVRGHTFDLDSEWQEIEYAKEILKQTGVDIWKATDEEIKNKLKELNVSYDGNNRERLTDTLWKYCRKSISGPAFLINHPLLVAPLAKPNSDGLTAQQFQPILAGSEVGRGYSELNDPRLQKANFITQQGLLDGGDEEAMMPDFEFVEMLEHGMPPTCGFGFGERLFAFLSGLPIRETQLFPLVKSKESK